MPFPITCAACQKTFSIADDVYERKVKGRVVTIKCKQCQAGIRVDGTKETPVFSLADSVRPPPVGAAPAPAAPAPELPSEPEPTTMKAVLPQEEPKTAPAVTAPAVTAPAVTAPVAPAPKVASAAAAAKAAPVAAAPKAAPAAAPKAASALGKTSPAAPAAKAAAAAPVTKAQPFGVKPPPAAPAVKTAPAPVAAAPKAPVVPATPKAPPVGVRPPPAAPALKAQAASPAPSPVVAPAALEAPSESLWAVDYPDGEDRELTLLEIRQALESGAINPATLVWRDGMDEWLELGQVAELKALTEPAKPGAVPAQRPKAASAPAFDLPPQRPKAASASAIDLPPQRPRVPSASAIDLPAQRPRAPSAPAFGLPELSATLPQAPAELAFAAPVHRPPAPSAPVIDFAPKGAPAVPAPAPIPMPIAARTPASFPAAPSIAGATNPFSSGVAAQPFGQPSPTPFGAVAPVIGLDEYPKKSKTPLIIGGVVLLAVAAGALFFLTRSSDEIPPLSPISALPATAPTTVHTAAPANTPTQDAPTAEQSAPTSGPNAAMQPPSGAPQTTPNAGFAELFANGARGADEKHGVSGPTQRFDPAAAKAALASAAPGTATCREKGGPIGKASVVVTFEPSGKVATATVSDAPFAGTSSGACIASALKRATVPAFSGLPGTVTKIISIQ